MSTADDVRNAADALQVALAEHAAGMVANGEPPEVMPAINRLGAAARHYADAVFVHTGWGNVFALAVEDEDDEE